MPAVFFSKTFYDGREPEYYFKECYYNLRHDISNTKGISFYIPFIWKKIPSIPVIEIGKTGAINFLNQTILPIANDSIKYEIIEDLEINKRFDFRGPKIWLKIDFNTKKLISWTHMVILYHMLRILHSNPLTNFYPQFKLYNSIPNEIIDPFKIAQIMSLNMEKFTSLGMSHQSRHSYDFSMFKHSWLNKTFPSFEEWKSQPHIPFNKTNKLHIPSVFEKYNLNVDPYFKNFLYKGLEALAKDLYNSLSCILNDIRCWFQYKSINKDIEITKNKIDLNIETFKKQRIKIFKQLKIKYK